MRGSIAFIKESSELSSRIRFSKESRRRAHCWTRRLCLRSDGLFQENSADRRSQASRPWKLGYELVDSEHEEIGREEHDSVCIGEREMSLPVPNRLNHVRRVQHPGSRIGRNCISVGNNCCGKGSIEIERGREPELGKAHEPRAVKQVKDSLRIGGAERRPAFAIG